jgi:hypothetical protein
LLARMVDGVRIGVSQHTRQPAEPWRLSDRDELEKLR